MSYLTPRDSIPYDIRAAIIGRGATKAVVTFSGGNDEGGADSIRLFDGDTKVTELEAVWDEWDDEMWDPEKQKWVPNTAPKPPTDKLAEWLTGLPEGRFSFNGEGYIDGTVTVDTTTGKIGWSVNQQVPSSSSWEE